MSHPILTGKSMIGLATFTLFIAFLNGGFNGPWQSKYDMPTKTKERYADLPEVAALFAPDAHPNVKKYD